MIERDFDVPFVADLALREKQIQQNYRPIIAIHKWFARRPGTLFRGLILSEFVHRPLRESFYQGHQLDRVRISDPFMGGGTPLMEANRLGCDVIGQDINPMSFWIVREEISHLDLGKYVEATRGLRQELDRQIGRLYRTQCQICGSHEADVKYWLWVKEQSCTECRKRLSLFPGYLVAENRRHPLNVLLCPACGHLNERSNAKVPGNCDECRSALTLIGPARRSRCVCPHCGCENRFPAPEKGPPHHRLFALEYHCAQCRPRHQGRFFKQPDARDLALYREAEEKIEKMRFSFAPAEEIPAGDETTRLHRWGYRRYMEMFNSRQLLGLELSCRLVDRERSERIRHALATNLSDLLRYQNMLCRYDTMALKSLDVFSVHGFPVGLVQCESNILGIENGSGLPVGSGGWLNITEKYRKAKAYCDRPFEIRHIDGRKVQVDVPLEWIGETRNASGDRQGRQVEIRCGSSTANGLAPRSLDGVFTDPPYLGNVQYAELMDFCYVWLRRLVGKERSEFRLPSTRTEQELTANESMGRGIEHFTEGLSAVFCNMSRALKKGAPLAFTYHHNSLTAYLPVAVAVLDAELVCSGSIPCPAEMGASIHINKTGSSIIDTVFVCRSTGRLLRRWLVDNPKALAQLIRYDVSLLEEGGVKVTRGDVRCILFGHLTRLAIWNLRSKWKGDGSVSQRLGAVENWISSFGGVAAVEASLGDEWSMLPLARCQVAQEEQAAYGKRKQCISF